MNTRTLWSRICVVVGGIAMLLGAVDPLEGSVVILAGSAVVLLGVILGHEEPHMRNYWTVVLGLIALGVAAMLVLSSFGGIGGASGLSIWWGALILPYPVGWIMGIASLLLKLVTAVRHRHVPA